MTSNHPVTLDMYDARTLALVIARAYACGYLELASIGITWVPRDDQGRYWTERRCKHVLRALVDCGYCDVHSGAITTSVRVNEAGFKALDINGQPAITDRDAERVLGPIRRW